MIKPSNGKQVKFIGTPIRLISKNDSDWKLYAFIVNDSKYKDIHKNKYGNVSVSGDIFDLSLQVTQYEVTAIETVSNYGYTYVVSNIKRFIESGEDKYDTYKFLCEILTKNQADVLYKTYPNIIDMVINNKADTIDLSRLKGIKETTFEKIKQKIAENYCLVELISEFYNMLPLTVVRKLYQEYTSIEQIKSKLKECPYSCLCAISGIGFKSADVLLLKMESEMKRNPCQDQSGNNIVFENDLRGSLQRASACVKYLLDENELNGNTKISTLALKQQFNSLVPECKELFDTALNDSDIYYNSELFTVAKQRTFEKEQYIFNKIVDTKFIKSIDKWKDIEYNKYIRTEEYELSQDQSNALKNLCSYPISILNGFAGSGKSFTTAAIVKMLDDNNMSYLLLSPTGKAAKVLEWYTHKPASTIHRGLAYQPPSTWGYNKDCPLNHSVVIVDEFSMCDTSLFYRLISAIDFSITKLLLIGDSAQLPSVAAGNLLYDFIKSGLIPTTTLTKIFRYGQGGILTAATDVRECKPYLTSITQKVTSIGDGDYSFISSAGEDIVNDCLSLYALFIKQGNNVEDIQVLTAYNKGDYGTVELNPKLQSIANKNCGNSTSIKIGSTNFYQNDFVMQCVNNYKARLADNPDNLTFIANGETGYIKDIVFDGGDTYALIDFNGILVQYSKAEMNNVSLAYCISIHKSQGSGIKKVILLTPKAHTYMLNSNLIYVGITRAKERCYHFGEAKTINRAIKEKDNFNRETNLSDLVKGYYNSINNKAH